MRIYNIFFVNKINNKPKGYSMIRRDEVGKMAVLEAKKIILPGNLM